MDYPHTTLKDDYVRAEFEAAAALKAYEAAEDTYSKAKRAALYIKACAVVEATWDAWERAVSDSPGQRVYAK